MSKFQLFHTQQDYSKETRIDVLKIMDLWSIQVQSWKREVIYISLLCSSLTLISAFPFLLHWWQSQTLTSGAEQVREYSQETTLYSHSSFSRKILILCSMCLKNWLSLNPRSKVILPISKIPCLSLLHLLHIASWRFFVHFLCSIGVLAVYPNCPQQNFWLCKNQDGNSSLFLALYFFQLVMEVKEKMDGTQYNMDLTQSLKHGIVGLPSSPWLMFNIPSLCGLQPFLVANHV